MPYQIAAMREGRHVCTITFRVKRDAFAVARVCGCLLKFSGPEMDQLDANQLRPDWPIVRVEGLDGWVQVKRLE
ncbi:hypothetical protein [Cupriavidus sp. H39]|uniref:hypothetical protein n=1 Tax=Cupriavidus sp. H39 TaxID=3401635 RepID=UPI003D03010C